VARAKKIYTIGHSNRSLSDFLEIIKRYNIRIIVDVRRFPKSSRYPYYNREELEKVLRENHVDYIWLGDLLGGYRNGGYEEYMKTSDYLRGIEKLLNIIERVEDNIAIMCSEKLWFKCHRRFIANTLVNMGYEVIHIIDKDKVYTHRKRNNVITEK